MAQQETPKIELKMIVLPVLFLLQKQIDLKDPIIINYVHIGIITMAIIGLTTYFYIKQIISSKNNNKKIWIPPKAPPSIPFLSPPSEGPPKAEDYTETTYSEHEQKLIMEAIQGIVMSAAIAGFMSYKFQVHFSCLMQAVLIPVGLYEHILVQKYIFGTNKTNLYNELLEPPQPTNTTNTAVENEDENDENNEIKQRVEELDENTTTTTTAPTTTTTTTTDLPSSDDDDTVKVEKSDANDID